MTETKYCPSDWLDEVVPCLVVDPSELIHAGGDTGWLMLADPEDTEEEFCPVGLTPGQIVAFSAHRNYGLVTIRVHEDAGFTVVTPYPPDANYFAHAQADFEDMDDTMEAIVARGRPDDAGKPLPSGRHNIRVWHWSQHDHLFRFEIVDGKGVFVNCGESH